MTNQDRQAGAFSEDALEEMAIDLGQGLEIYVSLEDCASAATVFFQALEKDGWLISPP